MFTENTTNGFKHYARFLLALIITLAVLLRIWGMGFGLPQTVHPDERLIADRAIDATANGHFKTGFYHWPNFLIYLLWFEYLTTYVAGHLVGAYSTSQELFRAYFKDPTFYFWIGRLTTTLFCVGGIGCIYLIGRKIAGRGAGIAATVLMSFDALFVEHSRYITPDVASVALMLYVFYMLLDYIDSGKTRILYYAAFVGGVAMSTKYNAGLILVPVLIAAGSRVQQWPSGEFPALTRRFGQYLLISIFLFGIGFIMFTPFSIFDFREFWHQLTSQAAHQEIGHLGMEASGSALLSAAAYFYTPYGIALLALTLAGLPSLNTRREYGLILLSFPVLYLITLAGWVVWADRYLLFLLPICFISAGVAIRNLIGYFGKHLPEHHAILAAFALALLLAAFSLTTAVTHAMEISKTDTRVASLAWINTNIPSGTPLVIEKGGPEPYHAGKMAAIGLDVSPVYPYRELDLWLSSESISDEPLEVVRHLNPAPRYIVSSGYSRDRYFAPDAEAKYPDLIRPWREYYNFIDTRCQLIAEFNPDAHSTGPWIKIYEVPPAALR